MLSLLTKKGQSTAEYAIVIALVVGAVLAMQTYVSRGMKGRVAGAADNFTTKIRDADWTSIFVGAEDTNPDSLTNSSALTLRQWEPGQLSARNTRKVLNDQANATSTTETLETGGTLTRDITQSTQQEIGDHRKYVYP